MPPEQDLATIPTLVRKHMPALDGVRGLAILFVLVHNLRIDHEWVASSLPVKVYTTVVESGWVGVQLFFVLSGFLITGLLLDAKGTPGYFRTFYTRRVLRIFPLYYASLMGYVLVAPLLFRAPAVLADIQTRQIWYWTYLSNWSDPSGHSLHGLSHFWSLAVEEQFYIVWPFVVLALGARGLARLCGGLIVAGLALRCAMVFAKLDTAWAYQITPARADALAIGALAAICVRNAQWIRAILPRIRAATIASIVAMVVVVALARSLSLEHPAVQTLGYTVLAFAFAILVLVAAVAPAMGTSPVPQAIHRALSWWPLRRLGKYSYALYVFHVPIKLAVLRIVGVRFADGSDAHRIAMNIVFLLGVSTLSILAALASWHLAEKRFLAMKDTLAPARLSPAA